MKNECNVRIIEYSNLLKYIGELKENKKEGYGICYYSNGEDK